VGTLDRYLIRQTIPPFLLALGIFTFMLAVQTTLEYARDLLAKGVGVVTMFKLLSLLLPSAISLAIPMAFLTGLLMALGRMSGDRESVAWLACGVSPLRLLRPILVLGVLVAGLDMYVLAKLTPDANQAWRDITFRLLEEHSSSEIRPRVFYEQFTNKVLYVRERLPGGRWEGVFLADTADPDHPSIVLAGAGGLVVDREQRLVRIVLEDAAQYRPQGPESSVYGLSSFGDASIAITAEEVFGSGSTLRGIREMTPAQLRAQIAEHRKNGISPHSEVMHLHQMASFPVACLVFAVVGLALGLNTRKEGRLAGLTLGLAVILFYYALFGLSEAWVKGIARDGGHADVAAAWARWIPNIGLGVLAAFALWRQTRPSGLTLALPAWLTGSRRRANNLTVAGPTAGPGAPVVVVRLPALGVPMPRLLDRYVGWRYLQIGSLAFLGLLALYYVGTFVDLADKLFKGQATTQAFASYLAHSTPEFVSFVLPVATLIAVLATIGGFTRTGELVVMRACGVSLYRAALPFFVFALAGSAVLFVLEDRVIAESKRTASSLRDQIRRGQEAPPPILSVNLTSQNWLVGDDGRFYHYTQFEPAVRANANRPTLHRLSVFEPDARGTRLRSHLFAARARFEDPGWHLEQGWIQRFETDPPTREDFAAQPAALARVEDFRRAQVDPSGMTLGESLQYIRKLAAGGYNVTDQLVNVHRRAAFPFVTIVMTLLAIPFGITIGRKGTLYGIGLAAILAGLYFLLMTFFVAVGAAGLLPAWLAAWAANIIFAAGAVFLMFSVRT
jgi:LPS export ABC transporter permease LptG/LPS export ABC transporter permease LptF